MNFPYLRRTRQAIWAMLGGQKAVVRMSQTYGRWLVLAALVGITSLIVSPYFYAETIDVKRDEVLQEPLRTRIPFEMRDPEEYRRWEQKRDREYTRVFNYDSGVLDRSLQTVDALFNRLRELDIREADLSSTPALMRLFDAVQNLPVGDKSTEGFILSEPTLQTLYRRRSVQPFIRDLKQLLLEVYERGVTKYPTLLKPQTTETFDLEEGGLNILPENLAPAGPRYRLRYVQDRPPEEFDPSRVLDYPDGIRDFLTRNLPDYFKGQPEHVGNSPRAAAAELLLQLIQPNILYNKEASNNEQERYQAGLDQLDKQLKPGDLILPAGTRILDKEYNLIQAYNAELRKYTIKRFLGNVGFTLLVVAIIGFYVLKFRRNFTFDINTTLLTGLPVVAVLAIERLLLVITESRTSLDLAGYAFPAGTIGMLGVLLLDVRLALVLVTWGCLLFGLEMNLNFEYVAVALLGGYTAVAALYTIRERREVVLAGLRIAFVNAAGILTISFINDPTIFPWRLAMVGVMNGILCSLLTIALLPVFEVLFGVITDMRLLELTGLHHPLTQRLEKEAPGTWQHTLNVTKLAEAAAQAIDVNYLLVRAGAYFHDIGKMRKSTYFTENQATPEDKRRHQELRPQMSVLIIRDHVKSGIEMARKSGLPQKIVDFIPQHHGTSLIKYFYHKALKQFEEGETKAPVREEDYRYPGPKPQSRETAIVMLADAVEATATAKLNSPHVREDDIRMVVHETVLDKFNDGQFDDCDLTLKDLQTIRETFFAQLMSRFHTRIDYPKSPEKREPPASSAKESRESPGRTATQVEAGR